MKSQYSLSFEVLAEVEPLDQYRSFTDPDENFIDIDIVLVHNITCVLIPKNWFIYE